MAAKTIDLSELQKALKSLEDSLSPPTANDRERDGTIQRFEYSFELSWKMAKRVLEYQGIPVTSPRVIFRELGQIGWIKNVEQWMDFLNARNASSHNYASQTAGEVFDTAKLFPKACQELIKSLIQALK